MNTLPQTVDSVFGIRYTNDEPVIKRMIQGEFYRFLIVAYMPVNALSVVQARSGTYQSREVRPQMPDTCK